MMSIQLCGDSLMKYLYGDFIHCPRCGRKTLFVHPFKVEKQESLKTTTRICQHYCRYYGTNAEKISVETCNKCIKLEVVEGELVCNNCGTMYKIENGIPQLLLQKSFKDAPQVAVFDKNVKEYDKWFVNNPSEMLFKIELKAIKEIMGRKKQYRSLEIGVGTGQFAKKLGITFGVDPSINALKEAQKRGVFTIQGIAENLPFQNDAFSLALMIVTLCYVREPLTSIKEAYRVLSPGGQFITCFIEKNSPWGKFYIKQKKKKHKFYGPAKFYTLDKVKEWLEKSGFGVKKIVWTLSQAPGQEKYIIEKPSQDFSENAGFVCIQAEKK